MTQAGVAGTISAKINSTWDITMAESHVVTSLVVKRVELAGRIALMPHSWFNFRPMAYLLSNMLMLR